MHLEKEEKSGKNHSSWYESLLCIHTVINTTWYLQSDRCIAQRNRIEDAELDHK